MGGRREREGVIYPTAVVFDPYCVLFLVDAERAGEEGGYGGWRSMEEAGA